MKVNPFKDFGRLSLAVPKENGSEGMLVVAQQFSPMYGEC